MEKRYKSLVCLIFICVMSFTAQAQVKAYAQNLSFFSLKEEPGLRVYPNPAVSQTTLSYQLSERANVYVRVVDLSGKQLAVLLPKQLQNSGKYEILFNFSKHQILPGMYIIHMIVNDKTYSKKIIVQ